MVYWLSMVLFSEVHAQNTSIKVAQQAGKVIVLAHDENDITLEYTGIYLHNAHKVQYQYMMEGVHDNWVNVGTERIARFNNLLSGDYTFKVKAANADGVWNETPLIVKIKILAPWWWTWWMKIIYGLGILGSIYAYYRFQLSKQLAATETKRLQELDEIKTKMYANITHEFRTPLSVIQGLAGQIEGNSATKEAIQRNSFNLLNLVNQMLDLSKLESGTLSLKMMQGDIINYLSYLTESFQSFAESKNIRLHFLSELDEFYMDYDPDKMMKMMANLLSNAIKFTEKRGDVYVQVTIKNKGITIPIKPIETLITKGELIIKVKDTGIGIPIDELPHIFDRFYQVDTTTTRKNEGTGIGLAFTRELVKIFKGKIQVESELGKGSIFTLQLPIAQHAPLIARDATTFLIKTVTATQQSTEKLADNFTVSTDIPLVLVVEDNQDVKTYLRSCLIKTYQLAFADDGQKGVAKALQLIPDIIISDVMMPEKDGYELCEVLKKDVRTSHIPIILLTAKADIDSKIFGLQKGADAYLAKPFNKEELLVRIEQLIHLRSELQERFGTALPPKEANLAQQDAEQYRLEEAFIQQVRKIILTNMRDESFDTTQLCKKLGISNSQFYRKLKAITGKSPAIYLRSIRLQKANELLHTTNSTISEIAYQVGFKETTYFSTCFSKEFGMSPRQARNG